MTIENSPTKGYSYIKIEIYHDNKNIDFDSIQEAYNQDMITLQNNENDILKDLQN